MNFRKKWTREELLVALNVYHKLTFGQLHARQPVIMALAEKLGRSGNSVAMKLSRCRFRLRATVNPLRHDGQEDLGQEDEAIYAFFLLPLQFFLPPNIPAKEEAFRMPPHS